MTLAIALAMMAHAARPAPKGPQPLGDAHAWITVRDYPKEAVIARQQGVTGFVLDVGANGLPLECRITSSSGSPALDAASCTAMMTHARFRPLNGAKRRGKRGAQPVAQPGGVAMVFRHSVRWKLPGRHQEQVVDRNFDAKSVVSPTGQVTSCVLSGAGASKIATSGGSCGPFGNRDFLQFFLKDDYRKTRGANVRMSISFAGSSPPPGQPPSYFKELARSAIEISPNGDMAKCTSLTKMEMLGHTLDLCDFIRAAPPRFPAAPATRNAAIILDLSAYFH